MSTKHQGKSRVIYTAKDSLDTVLPQQEYCITKIRHRIGVIFVPIFVQRRTYNYRKVIQ